VAVVARHKMRDEVAQALVLGQKRGRGFGQAQGKQFVTATLRVSRRLASTLPCFTGSGHPRGLGHRRPASEPWRASAEHGLKSPVRLADIMQSARTGDGLCQIFGQAAAGRMTASERLYAMEMSAKRRRAAIAMPEAEASSSSLKYASSSHGPR